MHATSKGRQGIPRVPGRFLLAALIAGAVGVLPAAQAFQASPDAPTDLPPLLTAKHPSRAKSGDAARVAQLSSAPLVLTVDHAELRQDHPGEQSVLDIRLAPESRKALAELTGGNVGRSVTLRADGEVLMTVVIRGPIDSGNLSVTPGVDEHGLTEAKMKQLAGKLSSGKSKLEISLLPRA
ncbi:hypothetical protein [Achromobacter aloeverae]